MTQELFDALAAPFPPERVSWRVGSVKRDGTAAMALAYIDARDVMERLDAVCGPAGWQRRHPHVNGTTTCELALRVFTNGSPELDENGAWKHPCAFEWVTKCDGAGDTAVEAEKGSLSDSFKRAAVNWGIGRYLYELPTPWVRIDQYKKILPEEMSKLEALLRRAAPAPVARAQEPPADPNRPPDAAPPEDGGRDETSGRKRAAQAKRDGDDEKIKAEIAALDMKGLADFNADFDRLTAHLPLSWLDPVRDMLESRFLEIGGTARVAEDDAAMTEAFRAAVGPASAPPVAGRNTQSRAAA